MDRTLPTAGVSERRAARRPACGLEVTLRQRGRFAVAASTADLSAAGCRLVHAGPFDVGSEVYVRLPGLESQPARVVWSAGTTTGMAFARPLHPAVYARFLPSGERLIVVGEPQPPRPIPADIAALPRREQILRGFGTGEQGPLQLVKNPLGGGLGGAIRREVARKAEHRAEQRHADTLCTGPMRLTVGAQAAEVRNVSASGLRVAAAIETDVGKRLDVAFEGFDPVPGVVVWRRGGEAGLSLPPGSIRLDQV